MRCYSTYFTKDIFYVKSERWDDNSGFEVVGCGHSFLADGGRVSSKVVSLRGEKGWEIDFNFSVVLIMKF